MFVAPAWPLSCISCGRREVFQQCETHQQEALSWNMKTSSIRMNRNNSAIQPTWIENTYAVMQRAMTGNLVWIPRSVIHTCICSLCQKIKDDKDFNDRDDMTRQHHHVNTDSTIAHSLYVMSLASGYAEKSGRCQLLTRFFSAWPLPRQNRKQNWK